MSLTNSQYDRIQREYSRRRAANQEKQQEHIREAFARIPQLQALEEASADLAFRRARALLAGREEEAARCARQSRDLREERGVLLAGAGYPADYLELPSDCPLCHDTGYVDGEKCRCLKRAMIDLLYHQSAIQENLERENFSSFSYAFYAKDRISPGAELSDYDMMKKNVELAWDFIDRFGEPPQNLLLMGQAGTGKTFLSNCIAKELLDRYHPVIYLSAGQFFDVLAKQAFSRDEGGEAAETEQYIYDCDLLIIDDLGTELSNAFVGSRLFSCINERILRGKSTLISTNLSMNDMLRIYTERVTSRLIGHYRILRFPDQDIRILKKMRQGEANHD
ncbi:MAG: ATP-binding protein [Lachnospiraceae bacterium]|nr:ATP-binding protein [Lachnospiraceae bacterium]